MSGLSIKDQLKGKLELMLNLNQKTNQKIVSAEHEPYWKLIIYDNIGQDVISPVLNIKELRSYGITLHLKLHSERDSIPLVPAIYFVIPNKENIKRICEDLKNHLYDEFYLNFITPLPRERLEDLATAAIESNSMNSIKKIFDQYLNFICLEPDMFILREQNNEAISYYSINKGDVDETEMHNTLDSITNGLFSLLVTLGIVPIIRAPKGNAAELVAKKLHKKLKDNLQDVRTNLFSNSSDFNKQTLNSHQIQRSPLSFQRPLLLILDRNIDLATPLHHTWTYQALIHDVLELKLNQLKLIEETEKGNKQKNYDLSLEDKFWQTHKGSLFPQVAQAIQEELDSFRVEEERLKSFKNSININENINEDEKNLNLISDTTAKITSAVSSLPELLEKKKILDMHTSIATAILEKIKKRKLDIFFEQEEKLLSRNLNTLPTGEKGPLELLTDKTTGNHNDKLRLILINYICSNLMPNELNDYEKILKEEEVDDSALKYIKHWKSINNSNTQLNTNYVNSISGGTKTISMFSKLIGQGSQFVMEGVKNLVLKKHNLPVTRIVDSLMEFKSGPELDEYLYLDSKILKSNDETNFLKNRTSFNEAIVFVIGGGNYIEYQNLIDYCKNKTAKSNPKKIVYGCTDLVNADNFLKQISLLGKEL